MSFLFGFFVGVFTLIGYMLWRMMRNDGWDDSNITNALRLISHVVLHPEDFGKMFYAELSDSTDPQAGPVQVGDSRIFYLRRPFWYVDNDELSEVVKTRP